MTRKIPRPWVALLLVSVLLTPTPRAGAAVGGVASLLGVGTSVLVAGGIVDASGLALAATGWIGFVVREKQCDSDKCTKGWGYLLLFGTLATAVGVVLMDETTGEPALRFTELDAETEADLQLTPEESAAYREKLPEINAAAESVQVELVAEVPTGKLGRREARKLADQLSARSKELWLEAKPAIGDDAFTAMAKIVARGQQRSEP